MLMPSPTPRAQRRSSAKNRNEVPPKERLREVGIRLFAARGFEGTGIRELGDAAGMSVATLYYHIGTKTNLLIDIMERSLRRIHDLAVSAIAECERPEDKLAALTRVHLLAHVESPDETTVVDTELRSLDPDERAGIVELRDRYDSLWQDVLDAGCANGTFTIINAKLARLSLLEMCSAISQWYVPDGPLSLEAVTTNYIDMVLALVRAQREETPLRVSDVALPTFEQHLTLVREAWAAKPD